MEKIKTNRIILELAVIKMLAKLKYKNKGVIN